MRKRAFDVTAAILVLTLLSPILLVVAITVWLQDFHSPFYAAFRAGRGARPFKMLKFRTMVQGADRTGVDSTAGNDPRITPVGRFLRKTKLDEVPQLLNVLIGQMSLVGPRPNVSREIAIYTSEEKRLLSVRPGVTDLASIVFSDEAEILRGAADPDLCYNQLIRPWKSRLGLLYVDRVRAGQLDLRIILLTIFSRLHRAKALERVALLVQRLGGDPQLVAVVRRSEALPPTPPPGATQVVTSRDVAPF
jgi:lipopolysaccharide/colanic/teichoic acid biosynthesis glycosyltransferase